MAVIDDIFNTGGDILDTVQQAAASGDFSHLSSDIRGKVEAATNEYMANVNRNRTTRAGAPAGSGQQTGGASGAGTGRTAGSSAGKTNYRQSYFLQTRPSRSGNVFKRIGLALGAAVSGSFAALFLAVTLMLIGESVPALIFSGIVTAALGGLTAFLVKQFNRGSSDQKLIERYYAYGKALGDAEYFTISDLAAATGRTEDAVRKDIEELRRQSILPYAAMDRNKTTVMLTDRVYKQYQAAELSRTQREETERKKAMQKAAAKGGSWGRTGTAAGNTEKETADEFSGQQTAESKASGQSEAGTAAAGRKGKTAKTGKTDAAAASVTAAETVELTGNAEIDAILKDGNAYIRKIHEVNDEIPDTEIMSDKLYRLENIMRRIFSQVRRSPQSAKDCRRLMNYYLPTTTKLLDAYVELYKQPEAGDNIRSSKQNIEETMDVINDAFEKLFDNMFETQAWDISSDINVMKTMMKQDGLAADGQSFGSFPGDGAAEEYSDGAAGYSDGYTDGFTDDLTEGAGAAAAEIKKN